MKTFKTISLALLLSIGMATALKAGGGEITGQQAIQGARTVFAIVGLDSPINLGEIYLPLLEERFKEDEIYEQQDVIAYLKELLKDNGFNHPEALEAVERIIKSASQEKVIPASSVLPHTQVSNNNNNRGNNNRNNNNNRIDDSVIQEMVIKLSNEYNASIKKTNTSNEEPSKKQEKELDISTLHINSPQEEYNAMRTLALKEAEETKTECPVCLGENPVDEICSVKCMHVICAECKKGVLGAHISYREESECPVCREPMDKFFSN